MGTESKCENNSSISPVTPVEGVGCDKTCTHDCNTGKSKKRAGVMRRIINHLDELGFTNRLALLLVFLLIFMVGGGFYLANRSIDESFTGALYCYTVIATPVGTALSVVLGKVVDKNKAENMDNGKGIAFAAAESTGFKDYSDDSPPI